MCGIAGWVLQGEGWPLGTLWEMTERVAHRGPDGAGYWAWSRKEDMSRAFASIGRYETQCAPVALGHRRLAILDLSSAGQQPMAAADGQVWITYNGEIYNYVELREDLAKRGHAFRTQTDTEVLLAAYLEWGTECFRRCNGMWALALIDLRTHTLVLSRDRLGIKPLYLWAAPDGVAFGSEIKQFFVLPGCEARANRAAITAYIETGYEHPPATMFEGMTAFPPGCHATMPLGASYVRPEPYWHPEAEHSRSAPGDLASVARWTRELFEDTVRLHLRADVPVGVCLSGGLDSSAILAQVQQLKGESTVPTHAFSALFRGTPHDESLPVHTMLQATEAWGHAVDNIQAMDFVEECETFLWHHDEPPGSLAQYAAWCVMRLASQHKVPVLLNGQGGDELFSGYWPAYYHYLQHHPWQAAWHGLGALLPGGNAALLGQAWRHLRRYRHRVGECHQGLVRADWAGPRPATPAWAREVRYVSPAAYRLAEIRYVHLPRLLKWDDRNSMAFSIEGRYPLLDHRLVEWALRLDPALNLHRGWNKYVWRQAMAGLVPRSIQWRKDKKGFETPQRTWVRTALAPMLTAWAAKPSERLQAILTPGALQTLAAQVIRPQPLPAMDEGSTALMRLYFLDRWLERFAVDVIS